MEESGSRHFPKYFNLTTRHYIDKMVIFTDSNSRWRNESGAVVLQYNTLETAVQYIKVGRCMFRLSFVFWCGNLGTFHLSPKVLGFPIRPCPVSMNHNGLMAKQKTNQKQSIYFYKIGKVLNLGCHPYYMLKIFVYACNFYHFNLFLSICGRNKFYLSYVFRFRNVNTRGR